MRTNNGDPFVRKEKTRRVPTKHRKHAIVFEFLLLVGNRRLISSPN